jgi:hypothetical protein
MFKIIDWTGNTCFRGKEFQTFEDAWGFIYDKFPNGDDDGTFDDYFVVETEED